MPLRAMELRGPFPDSRPPLVLSFDVASRGSSVIPLAGLHIPGVPMLRSLLAVNSCASILCATWLTCVPTFPASAEPFEKIVNVNGKLDCSVDGSQVELVQLPAGSFEFEPIGLGEGGIFVAMNPWGGVVIDCDPDGTHCRKGWRWRLQYSIDGGSSQNFGSTGIFSTAERALQEALPTQVQLSTPGELRLWVEDTPCSDNHGGFSIRVRVVTSAPTQRSSWSQIKGLYR